jgi:hypothetical protein
MKVLRRQPSYARARQPVIFGWTVPLACLLLLLAGTPVAQSAVSLLLEQPYGKLNLINPAGHSAIYLDHVCAETPLKLRPCRTGEQGVVLSRYDGIGGHDWVAMPLIPYLYSVGSISQIPYSIDRASEMQLRDVYRRQYLQAVAPDRYDGGAPGGNWYELLGSAFDRTIYGFRVNTTAEQDAQLIATFNDRGNTELYNGAFRNCADFARVTINRFYPHAVHRNYVADLGLTSPKSVARSLSHYAARHPETGFEVFVIPQVKGSLPRSHANTDVAEGILKRYGVPLVVVSPVSTAVVFAAYIGQGRFSMPKDPPLLDISEIPTGDPSDLISRPFPPTAPVLPQPAPSSLMLAYAGTRTTMAVARSVDGSKPSLVRVGMAP